MSGYGWKGSREHDELITAACGSHLKPEFSASIQANGAPSTRQGHAIEKAKNLIGWMPEMPIEEGIRRLVAWLDAEKAGAANV